MAEQIHKRLSVEFVDEVMEAFNEQRVTERAVCEVLGIKRSRLYEIRKKWLRCKRRGEGFRLWDRSRSDFHKFPEEIEEWLHEELQYIRNEADLYRGRFNFAFLGERAEREFGHPFQRNSLRRFAFRHGYYLLCLRRNQRFIHALRPQGQESCFNMIGPIICGFPSPERGTHCC